MRCGLLDYISYFCVMEKGDLTTSFLWEQRRCAFRRDFPVMVKVVGPACNLDCDYCYYVEKEALYPGMRRDSWRMTPRTLELVVRDTIASQLGDKVTFIWHGGEPTLAGLDFFKEAVRLQRLYGEGKTVENVLQTNGTLIDERWAAFLAEENFLCGLSVDGPEFLHDAHRRYADGRGTWRRVAECARLFRRYGVEFNTMTTVNATNARHPLAVYEAMRELGSRFMQFIPIVERVADDEREVFSLVTPKYERSASVLLESVEAREWGNFLCRVFDVWVRRDVGVCYVNIFDNTLAGYVGEPQLCSMNARCTCSPAVEFNGDVYLCDHLVYPEYRLGNVLERSLAEMVKDDRQLAFEAEKEMSLSEKCRKCEFLRLCGGDCPKNRYAWDGEGVPLSSLCEGFRLFFTHTRRAFEFMAAELAAGRAPANVMRCRDKF